MTAEVYAGLRRQVVVDLQAAQLGDERRRRSSRS